MAPPIHTSPAVWQIQTAGEAALFGLHFLAGSIKSSVSLFDD
jgi:hypothetical protein